ncbi:MAG: tetratricopeptide repeat protein [candidate division Zixibacteria bacterium]|nr:tetratricopeptide repeat protein [candidate division Zixibacteria bacterium]
MMKAHSKSLSTLLKMTIFCWLSAIQMPVIMADDIDDYFEQFDSSNPLVKDEIIVPDAEDFNPEAVELEKEATDFFWKQKNPVQAMELFHRALKIEPRLVYAPFHMSFYYRAIDKDRKKAVKLLKQALKHHPQINQYHIELAETYLVFEKYKDAIKSYKNALNSGYPEQASIFFNIGLACYEAKKYESCIKYCNLALSLEPEHEKCRNILAMAYILEDDEARAIETVGDSLAYFRIAGKLFLDLDKNTRAWDAIQRGISIDSLDFELQFYKALVLASEKKYKLAISVFDKLLESEPEHFSCLSHKGLCLVKLGEYDQALDAFHRLDELYPEDTRAKCAIGGMYFVDSLYSDALYIFNEVLAIEPNNPYANEMAKILKHLVK